MLSFTESLSYQTGKTFGENRAARFKLLKFACTDDKSDKRFVFVDGFGLTILLL